MVTLTQYLLQQLAAHPDRLDLVLIMSDLATIGKYISREVNRAGLAGIRGTAGMTNIQNEEVQKLDVFANTTCKEYLRSTGHFAALASEEEETVVDMGEYGKDARYVIAFDPLDGSTNIDANAGIGTIFSVLRRRNDIDRTDERQFLQPGSAQVLAGYLLYSASTVLVFTHGDGVHECTLDPALGEFLLSRDCLTFPSACPYYSVNEGKASSFPEKDQAFIQYLKEEKKCSTRYIGTLVADLHRTLVTGGVFLYPSVFKESKQAYEGKLRLNYELKPLAWLVEQAGGRAIDGKEDILTMQPAVLHQRSACIFGNRDIIEYYLSLL